MIAKNKSSHRRSNNDKKSDKNDHINQYLPLFLYVGPHIPTLKIVTLKTVKPLPFTWLLRC